MIYESELNVKYTEGDKTTLNVTKTELMDKGSEKDIESKFEGQEPVTKAVQQKLMVNKFREAFARIVEQT